MSQESDRFSSAREADIILNGKACHALVDTGSQVSTIGKSVCDKI